MKNFLILAISLFTLTFLSTGCSRSESDKQRQHELNMARAQNTTRVHNTSPIIHHPQPVYYEDHDMATGMVLGAVVAAVALSSMSDHDYYEYNRSHHSYTPRYNTSTTIINVNGVNQTQYLDRKGKVISKTEYSRRATQSKADKTRFEKAKSRGWKKSSSNKTVTSSKSTSNNKFKNASAKTPKRPFNSSYSKPLTRKNKAPVRKAARPKSTSKPTSRKKSKSSSRRSSKSNQKRR